MISEALEFQICCYADGSATAEEARAVEAAIAGDPEARQLLEEYRTLIAAVRETGATIPDVRWHGLAAHLSRKLDVKPARNPWNVVYARAALAASIVIAAGLAILAEAPPQRVIPAQPMVAQTAPAQLDVSGPVADASAAPAKIEIAVEPAISTAGPADQGIYAADLVADAQRVEIGPGKSGY